MKKGLLLLYFISCISYNVNAQFTFSVPNPPGYFFNRANGICIDHLGNLCVAWSKFGLGVYNGSTWAVYDSLNSPLPNRKILSISPSSTGVWLGTNSGLFHFDGSAWLNYTTSNSTIPFDSIPSLYASGSDVWMFSNTGIVHFNGATFQQFNTSNSGLISDSVQCMSKDSAGILWIGTKHGLSSYNGSAWQNFTIANSELLDDNIRCLVEDAHQYLFIGTPHNYIYLKTASGFTALGGDECNFGTFFNPVHNLLRLNDGRILNSGNFISTDPVSIVPRSSIGFNSADTSNYFYIIDTLNRIWRTQRSSGYSYMTDSIETYPISVNSTYYNFSRNSRYAYLDINDVRCPVWNNNTIGWLPDVLSDSRYEVPKDCGRSPIFCSELWIAGLDNSNNLHVAAQTYRQQGDDFWAGPLDTINASIDSVTRARYDSVWKVNRTTINEFRTEYLLGNVTSGSYTVPAEILNWCANSSGTITRNLAPYIDYNSDGVYNPYDGDYPDIKGDQMIWWVMNDNFDNHWESYGTPFGIEIQGKAYAYSCPLINDSSESVNYTTFYSYEIFNRSDTDYHDVHIGANTDAVLGDIYDDFTGCSVEGDYAYIYNSDNNDESWPAGGYGINPPMASIAILKGSEADAGDG